MRSTPLTRKACTERLYSVTMMVLRSLASCGRMPMARDRSITGRVWPRRLTTPQTNGWRCGISVSLGMCRTSCTLNTLMANSWRPARRNMRISRRFSPTSWVRWSTVSRMPAIVYSWAEITCCEGYRQTLAKLKPNK
ncbi:hypothetical protein D9M69_419060 [compost metagenome]